MLENKLTEDTDLPQGTRDYTPGKYKTDPLIENLSSIKLSQFLNLVNGGHPLYWGLYNCPWCGEEANACHIIDVCGIRNAADYIRIALNTSAHIDQRILAAERVISFGGEIEKALQDKLEISGKNIIPIISVGGRSHFQSPSVPDRRDLKRMHCTTPSPLACRRSK